METKVNKAQRQFEEAYKKALPDWCDSNFSKALRSEFTENELRMFAVKMYNAGRNDGWSEYYEKVAEAMMNKVK